MWITDELQINSNSSIIMKRNGDYYLYIGELEQDNNCCLIYIMNQNDIYYLGWFLIEDNDEYLAGCFYDDGGVDKEIWLEWFDENDIYGAISSYYSII